MAAKTRILLLCSALLCLPAFANVPRASLLNEKPHQGLAAANALSASGIAGCLCDEGRSSRSTCKENEIESDALGRVTLASQKPAGVALPYSFEFLFHADGTLATLRYPLSYAPHGALAAAQWGNGVTEAWTYNNRLQALTMQASKGGLLLGLTYGYGTTNNNGNVLTQKIEAGSQKTYLQSYLYDDVNRLTQVNESTSVGTGNPWWMSFGYGRYGNRWVSGMTPQITLPPATPIASNQYDESKNRLIKQNNGQNLPSNAHDEAGNLQNHPDLGAMLFDGQNRLVRHTAGGAVVNFLYDAEGRRVKKTSINGTVHYLYGPSGQLLAEDGGAAWPGAPARRFLTSDALGSTRMVTDSNGVVKERRDYHPFGEEIQASSVFGNRQELTDGGVTTYNEAPLVTQRFTGKERDGETGLDWMKTRYFSGSQGRFISPDRPFADQFPEDPQSWNLHSYVRNNPLKLVDDDGQSATLAGAVGGAVVGGAVSWWRGQDVMTGALKGAIAGAVAGSVIDTGGASLGVLALSGAAGGVTAGAIDRTISGQGTTISDVGRDAAIGAVAGAVLGQAGKAIGAKVAEAMLASEAAGARDAVAGAAGKGTATVVGAYDAQTGSLAVGRSGAGLNPVNPQVAAAAQRAGGLGARNPGVRGAVGNCAECNAANQLTNQGSRVGNVRFTPAVRPRTGEVVPKCQNCETMFPNQ